MTIPAQAISQDFITGRSHHAGYALPLALHPLDACNLPRDRLCMVYLARGSAVLPLRAGRSLVVAPAVVLATTPVSLLVNAGAEGTLLSFEPGVVNGELSLALLDRPGPLAGTVEQDAYLLRPFIDGAQRGRPIPLDSQLDAFIRQTFERIAREGAIQADANWPCRTRSFLIELLFRLRLGVDRAPVPCLGPDAVLDKALPLIRERLAEKLSVAELASLCGTNRSTLNSAFRAATGQSVHAYVIQLRIEMASTLLRDTGLPVAEIMARVGYENASHFGRQFKALLGVGPRRYRDAESTMPGRRRPAG